MKRDILSRLLELSLAKHLSSLHVESKTEYRVKQNLLENFSEMWKYKKPPCHETIRTW